MRKIERDMLNAINSGKNWTNDNTMVKHNNDGCAVFLHGNHIATVVESHVTVNKDTLINWPSVTTKSRLRALGVNVTTKKGVTYIDGNPVA